MKIIFKLTKLCDSFANGIFVHCIFYLDIRILMLFFNDTNTNKRITKHNNYLRNSKPMIYWQFVRIDAIENKKKTKCQFPFMHTTINTNANCDQTLIIIHTATNVQNNCQHK